MTYEYHALKADRFPPPEQLNGLGEVGWRLVQIIDTSPYGERGFVIYFMREKAEAIN